MTTQTIQQTFTLPSDCAGQRLDHALAQCQPDYSRARWQHWLKHGMVSVDGAIRAPKYKLKGGETVTVNAILAVQAHWQAQPLALDIVYEDDDILIINKAANCVVHPAAGNPDGTLVNALLHHAPALETLPRAGLIHRLDKDTTGLLVVAKTLSAHHWLVKQLEKRLVKRQYLALVNGNVIAGGSIDAPIGRHPKQRIKMAVVETGKPALTHYRVLQRFAKHTLLLVELDSGRTHQIRVHMQYRGYPLVGDPLYGKRVVLPPDTSDALREVLSQFKRQALHATRLGFVHPRTGDACQWHCPAPTDLQRILAVLI